MSETNVGQYVNRNTLIKKIMAYEKRLCVIDMHKYTKEYMESINSDELYRIFRMIDYWNSQVR